MFFNLLLVFVPISLVLGYLVHSAPALAVFATGALAIVPLAEWMRKATEQLARIIGPALGGLLNVTFGNLPELILGFFVLAAGKVEVVKGQITGSIIGNSLLGLGLAALIGSWGSDRQSFDRERAGLLSSLLLLAVIALLVPALFDYTERTLFISPQVADLDEKLSLGVAVILVLLYGANLLYTLYRKKDLFATEKEEERASWSLWTALAVLVGATALTAVEAELVSAALEASAAKLHVTLFFLGVFVLAVIGNAAEYVSAIYFARRGQMELTLNITVGSSIQVALLVAPLLVLGSYFLPHPMDLVFANPLEMIALTAAAFIVAFIAHDGQTNWFEGLLLLSVYAILGLAFFFATPPPPR